MVRHSKAMFKCREQILDLRKHIPIMVLYTKLAVNSTVKYDKILSKIFHLAQPLPCQDCYQPMAQCRVASRAGLFGSGSGRVRA